MPLSLQPLAVKRRLPVDVVRDGGRRPQMETLQFVSESHKKDKRNANKGQTMGAQNELTQRRFRHYYTLPEEHSLLTDL